MITRQDLLKYVKAPVDILKISCSYGVLTQKTPNKQKTQN